MIRKEAREALFTVLFAGEFQEETTPTELWQEAVEDGRYEKDRYAESLAVLLSEHAEEIISIGQKYAVGWKWNRISPVARTVLKIALTEMFYMPDIPLLVSLNEAVEISKKYDDEKAYGFVNGVLNAAMTDPRAVEKK